MFITCNSWLHNNTLYCLIKLSDIKERSSNITRIQLPEKINLILLSQDLNILNKLHANCLLIKLTNQTLDNNVRNLSVLLLEIKQRIEQEHIISQDIFVHYGLNFISLISLTKMMMRVFSLLTVRLGFRGFRFRWVLKGTFWVCVGIGISIYFWMLISCFRIQEPKFRLLKINILQLFVLTLLQIYLHTIRL